MLTTLEELQRWVEGTLRPYILATSSSRRVGVGDGLYFFLTWAAIDITEKLGLLCLAMMI